MMRSERRQIARRYVRWCKLELSNKPPRKVERKFLKLVLQQGVSFDEACRRFPDYLQLRKLLSMRQIDRASRRKPRK